MGRNKEGREGIPAADVETREETTRVVGLVVDGLIDELQLRCNCSNWREAIGPLRAARLLCRPRWGRLTCRAVRRALSLARGTSQKGDVKGSLGNKANGRKKGKLN